MSDQARSRAENGWDERNQHRGAKALVQQAATEDGTVKRLPEKRKLRIYANQFEDQ